MRRIRKLDSGPELVVRRLAHHLGFRYRLYRRDLPGTPDLAFPKLRKAIFVNGCFWHQHSGRRLARVPARLLAAKAGANRETGHCIAFGS
jgi:DNA mismatch endonuclease (patch repair protein)